MAITISADKLGSTNESVNVQTITRSQFTPLSQSVATQRGQEQRVAEFTVEDGTFTGVTGGRFSHYKDKAPTGSQKFSANLHTTVHKDDSTLGRLADGEASATLTFAWPNNIEPDYVVARRLIDNLIAMLYASVSSGTPNAVVLTRLLGGNPAAAVETLNG